MNKLWHIINSEFRNSGLFAFFAVASMPIYFLTFYIFGLFDLELTARLALPQIVIIFAGIPTLFTFKQKRDRMLAQLPVSLRLILYSRYLSSLLLATFYFLTFLIFQYYYTPGLEITELLMQAASLWSLAMYSGAIWMMLIEMNFHSRQNWWKLVVALLMFIVLLFFISLTMELLASYQNPNTPAEHFFTSNALWLLLAENLVSLVIFAIAGMLFLRRGSYTGKATSTFMERASC